MGFWMARNMSFYAQLTVESTRITCAQKHIGARALDLVPVPYQKFHKNIASAEGASEEKSVIFYTGNRDDSPKISLIRNLGGSPPPLLAEFRRSLHPNGIRPHQVQKRVRPPHAKKHVVLQSFVHPKTPH